MRRRPVWVLGRVVVDFTPMKSKQLLAALCQERVWSWLVGLGGLFLYGATAAPSIVELFDDSLEFQLVGPTFGIAHPTGYPLYILLGGLWSRVLFPLGNWAWRMNLFSALAAAATLGLLFRLACRLFRRDDGRCDLVAALASTVAFGLGPVWWSQATVAEVYALHGLLMVAMLNLALDLPQLDPAAARRRISFLCVVVGLALAHHRTTLLALPAVGLYLLWRVPGLWRPGRHWLAWLAALGGPLLLYLYLPVRAAMGVRDLHGSYANTWQGFWDHVLARGYFRFLTDNPFALERTPAWWFGLFQEQVGLVGLGLALLGVAWIVLRRQRPAAPWLLLALLWVSHLAFALRYQVADVPVFLLPAFLVVGLFAGAGLAGLRRMLRPWSGRMVGTFLLVLLALGTGGRGPAVNRSQVWSVHNYAVAMASVPFPPQSQVIGLEGEITALLYMQQAAGLGQNATGVVADDPEERRRAVAEGVEAGLPVYLTRELAGIEDLYSFSGEGPLVRVWPRGEAQSGEPEFPRDEWFMDGRLHLEGYDLVILEQPGNRALRLALYWRPQTALEQVAKVSLRLEDSSGNLVHWPDGRPAVSDQFPLRLVSSTRHWLPGERIRDVYYLDLPGPWSDPAVQPSRLRLILYDAETLAELGQTTFTLPGSG